MAAMIPTRSPALPSRCPCKPFLKMTGDPVPTQFNPNVATSPDLSPIKVDVGSLTFADLLRVVFERRKMLLICTAAAVLLGAIYVIFFGALYRSEAVLNLRYVSFAEYKRYSPALSDRDRFIEYAARSKQFSDDDIERIRRAIGGPDALNRWIRPLFTITKADVKEAAETPEDA